MPIGLPNIKATIPDQCPSCGAPIVVPLGETLVDQCRYSDGYSITFYRESDGRAVDGHDCR